jgi:hypothetical protein
MKKKMSILGNVYAGILRANTKSRAKADAREKRDNELIAEQNAAANGGDGGLAAFTFFAIIIVGGCLALFVAATHGF